MAQGKSSHFGKLHQVVQAALDATGQKPASHHTILSFVCELRAPKSACDFGCGEAKWLRAARDLGATRIRGYDIPEIPLASRGLTEDEFVAADLTKPISIESKFDLAISLEVGEHLPFSAAPTFVRSITGAADWVLFGASPPYQGGMGHVNENWMEYWAKLFRQAGYLCYDIIRPRFWHDARVAYYYRQNTCLYVREGTDEALRARGYAPVKHPLSFIHPELYIKAVSMQPPPAQSIRNDVKIYYRYAFNAEDPVPDHQETTYGAPAPRTVPATAAESTIPAGEPQRFVILASMRTGSNALNANLNQIKGLVAHGEVFNGRFVGLHDSYFKELGYAREDIARRDADPRAFLTQLFKDRSAKAIGIHLFPADRRDILDLVLRDASIKKIGLRRSLFQSYASLQIAKQTDVWRITTAGPPNKPHNPKKFVFDRQDFEEYRKGLEDFWEQISRTLRETGQEMFPMWYSKINNVPKLNEIAEFIGIDSRLSSLTQVTVRQNPLDLSHKVENWDELLEYAKDRGLEGHLH